jgi:hypothetical protein
MASRVPESNRKSWKTAQRHPASSMYLAGVPMRTFGSIVLNALALFIPVAAGAAFDLCPEMADWANTR